MFKVLLEYLQGFLKGWISISKRVSKRTLDQVFLILTLILLENFTVLIWAAILYQIMGQRG